MQTLVEACKSINVALQKSSFLRYIIQLHFDGFQDLETKLPYPELLQELLNRRGRWLSTNTCRPWSAFKTQYRDAYDLVDGVFEATNWEKTKIELAWIPTSDNDSERIVEVDLPGMRLKQFGIEPRQDLLILVEINEM
ncbi:hypothetical protein BDN70DRAFT_934002 [Pholiota conissans]|uniref:Uncharacterized protein n=1 Tax=Pholiota conissans TaxID=109636 RepID=A0A9P5YXN0_9AGAR|nr:hypothetical protein BDN70DRAFT_934002 [Pholiota conissans]